jgi:Arc/MetJ family transcription regulator
MRTTVTIDDSLMADLEEFTGIEDRAEAIRFALKGYVQFEAGRRLALLGGTMPDLRVPPRRRPPTFVNAE